MDKIFSRVECINIYEKLISRTEKCIKNKDYNTALLCIKTASRWAYHFNWIYADKRIDQLALKIGRNLLPPFEIKNNDCKRYLLIDTHGIDNRGLTQQYIRGLMAMNVEFLFISLEPIANQQRDIRKELEAYPKATTLYLDGKLTQFERLISAANVIKEYQPQIALAHVFPWDAISFMLFDAAKGMKVYNINFTDHAFWMGSSIIDYNIEFRDYGMSVSLDKRNLKKEQLVYLPYYPIKPLNEPFQGFPVLPKDSIIILSGGSFYKMLGENDMFFKMCDQILDISSKAILLIAGTGNVDLVKQKISIMRNSSKVYLIGDRRDINEVFKHCDIYLNTYPVIGGLMSQYAAINSKPIVTLGKKDEEFSNIEGIVNHFGNNVKTFYSLKELLEYTRKCINDEEFRISEGIKNKKALISEKQFNQILSNILLDKYSDLFNWKRLKINYDKISNLYLDVENNNSKTGIYILLSTLRFHAISLFPKYILYFLSLGLKKLIRVSFQNWRID